MWLRDQAAAARSAAGSDSASLPSLAWLGPQSSVLFSHLSSVVQQSRGTPPLCWLHGPAYTMFPGSSSWADTSYVDIFPLCSSFTNKDITLGIRIGLHLTYFPFPTHFTTVDYSDTLDNEIQNTKLPFAGYYRAPDSLLTLFLPLIITV